MPTPNPCLEQQRIGLPSCKTRTVHFIYDFGAAVLEIIASNIKFQIKPALSSIVCQHVAHTIYLVQAYKVM